MINKTPLTSKISNNIFIVMGLLISIPILCFIIPMYIAIIIAPFQPEPVDWSDLIGLSLMGLIFLFIPIYLLSIIFRMRHIYIIDSGLYFKSQTFPWKDIEKIKHPIVDSGKFTIVYKKNNKRKKVFGALFLFGFFGSTPVIYKLYNIAEKQNIPILKTWWG
jgi:hypothetical protein